MSATVETSSSSWRKRHCEEDTTSPMERKRPRYYYRLESESSKASEEDTESVYSLQDRETDVVRDTSDTDSKSGCSDQDEYEVIEYEVDSLSESDNGTRGNSSSGSEDMILAAAAAVICDSSLETWITDCEESDNSSLDDSAISRSDFSTCAQCKSINVNPLYRYCEKCYQSCRQCKMRKTYKGFPLCLTCHKDRKRFFPPRPRGNKKSRRNKKSLEPPVKLDTLRSCLSGLSQDSGIGSSQECPVLELDRIVVPDEHLLQGTSEISTSDNSESVRTSSISIKDKGKSRKRQNSESSLSDFEVKKPKVEVKVEEKPIALSHTSDLGSETSVSPIPPLAIEKETVTVDDGKFKTRPTELKITALEESKPNFAEKEKHSPFESSELCIFCNNAPKNSIFLHTNIAHQCCCYRCAKRTLNTFKRCPICNRSVNKVVKIYTS